MLFDPLVLGADGDLLGEDRLGEELLGEALLWEDLLGDALLGEDLLELDVEAGRDFFDVSAFSPALLSGSLAFSALADVPIFCSEGAFLLEAWRNFAVRDFLDAAIACKFTNPKHDSQTVHNIQCVSAA